MCIKFYSYNLVDQESTVITASENNAQFPSGNLKDPRRTKKYRSLTNTCTITFDFINPQPVDSFIIVDDPIQGFNFNTPVTIEGNSTSNFAAPAFSTTLTEKDDRFGIAYKELDTPESYRYWRLTLDSSVFVELSNIFIGKRIEFTDTGINFGWTYQDNDRNRKRTNKYGQEFIEEINSQKRISAQMQYLNKDEMDQVFEIYDYNRNVIPFYLRFDCDILNDKDRFSGMFRFSRRPAITNSAPSLYDIPLPLIEAL